MAIAASDSRGTLEAHFAQLRRDLPAAGLAICAVTAPLVARLVAMRDQNARPQLDRTV